MQKACTVCGAPSGKSARCPLHPYRRSPSSHVTSHRRHKQRRQALINSGPLVCHLCNEAIESPDDMDADHVQPAALDGPDTADNLKPAHRWCNRSKGAKV